MTAGDPIHSRGRIERDEAQRLASYAVCSGASLGRRRRESHHPYRTGFQRDRARIIHSASFRRLDGKTQVFLNGTGDHYRTRLTHTLEVASISRTVSRALGLNEDLAEAIALAHDLGHPPFGHAGEETLDRLMRPHGGFDHNLQSLRVVELLEEKYPGFRGLNLSYEVLEGLRKHEPALHAPDGTRHKQPSLEAQVADMADEITYYSHDLDDGIDAGFLDPEDLLALRLWREAMDEARPQIRGGDTRRWRGFIIRCLVNREVDDLVRTSAARLRRHRIQSLEAVRNFPKRLIGYSREMTVGNRELRRFLYRNFYHSDGVAGVHRRCCSLLEESFARLVAKPSLLGRRAAARVRSQGLERTVTDYLAGMTDRYLMEMHARWINS